MFIIRSDYLCTQSNEKIYQNSIYCKSNDSYILILNYNYEKNYWIMIYNTILSYLNYQWMRTLLGLVYIYVHSHLRHNYIHKIDICLIYKYRIYSFCHKIRMINLNLQSRNYFHISRIIFMNLTNSLSDIFYKYFYHRIPIPRTQVKSEIIYHSTFLMITWTLSSSSRTNLIIQSIIGKRNDMVGINHWVPSKNQLYIHNTCSDNINGILLF